MPKKTSRPEMSWIEARQQWRKRVIVGGRQRDVYGKKQEDVREKVRELKRQEENGLVIGDNTSFAHFAKQWFEVKAPSLKPKSVEVYRNALNNHIMPEFGNTRLRDLRPLHIEKLMASKAEYSHSAQAKILFTVSQIMKSAVKNGLIVKNPCEDVRAAGYHSQEKVPLTKTQQETLTDAVKGNRAELFVLLCLYAGLRREEALGLMWQNVHLQDNPHIDVRHTVTFDANGNPLHSESLKTKAAYRTVTIPPVLADALRAARIGTDSLLVIPAMKSGTAMSLSSFRKMWNHVPRLAGFPLTPHLLRHTYITRLCSARLDPKKIQYLAGHEDVYMTLRIYAHATDTAPEEMSPIISEIFSRSC